MTEARAITAAEAPAIEPGSKRAWLLACRPATLTAVATPVAVGTACCVAENSFALWPALAALFGAMFLQIGSNFANDVFDYEKGADTEARLGPTRAVQSGLLQPSAVRRGMVVVFGLASVFGAYLTWVAGPAVIAIGIASIVCAIAYTGGPYPLGYHGLGDVFVMIFFGFVAVCGTALVQAGSVPALAWYCAVPVGALATNILVVNNVRDQATDVLAGKRTRPVRFGRRAGIAEYGLMLALAYGTPLMLFVRDQAPVSVLLPWVTLPGALILWRRVATQRGEALNPTLVLTAKLLFGFGLCFAVGISRGN